MKNVLFLGGTTYNLTRENKNLEKKFSGLSQGINVFVVARGKPWHKKIYCCKFYLVPAWFGIFKWPICFFRCLWLCLRKDIQTIVTQSPLIDGLIGVILKKVFKKELIVEIHGDWREAVFLYGKRRSFRFLKSIPSVFGKISLKNADKIRGVANYLLLEAKEIAPDKQFFIFPTFTDVEFFLQEKNVSFGNFILFVGYLNKVKGVNHLIDAFSKIKDEFPEFQLVIVGAGPEEQNLQTQTQKLKISQRIDFKGGLSVEGVKEIMKDCYCFVSPSLSEGLPLVLREAMALSKPLIGSRVGGIPELIKDKENGFLFESTNSDELAEKLRTLLKDKELAFKMGKKGREIIEKKFSSEKYINDYLEMINT